MTTDSAALAKERVAHSKTRAKLLIVAGALQGVLTDFDAGVMYEPPAEPACITFARGAIRGLGK